MKVMGNPLGEMALIKFDVVLMHDSSALGSYYTTWHIQGVLCGVAEAVQHVAALVC